MLQAGEKPEEGNRQGVELQERTKEFKEKAKRESG